MIQNRAFNRLGRAVVVEPLEDRRLLSATLTLQNLDGLPTNDRLVFNRLQNLNPQVNDIVHDTDTLRLQNTGNQPLIVSGVTLSDPVNFTIVNPPAPGTAIAPNGTLDLVVKFVAQTVPPHSGNQTNDSMTTDGTPVSQAGGVYTGSLSITSNDPNRPTSTVQLAGYWQKSSEHEEEPSLQTIINLLYGYGTNIANTQVPDLFNNGSTVVPSGEEVLSGLWSAADPSQPVSVRELATFHTQVDPFNAGHLLSANLGWYAQGSGVTNHLFSQAVREAQTLLPQAQGSSGPAQGSFRPNGAFGFNVDGEFSQDNLNTTDINTYHRSGHAVRFFPARDSQGNLIPNTWIMAEDYQNSQYDNFDYQDNLYLVSNMRPVTQAPAPASVTASPGKTSIALQWTAVNDGSLIGYNVYHSTSPTGPFAKINGSPMAATAFTETGLAPNTTEYYRVTAVDSAGESEGTGASATTGSVGAPPPGGGGLGVGSPLALGPVTGKFPPSVVGGALEKAPARVTLTNNSSQAQKGVVEIDLFASKVPGQIPDGAPLATIMRHINLRAGKSKTFTLPRFHLPSDLSGDYFLVAEVKGVSGISETTGANSSASAIKVAAPFVDIQNLFTGPAPALVPGKQAVVVLPVMNNGNIAARGTVMISVTASTDRSGAGGTTLASLTRPISLPAGKMRNLRLRFLVPTLKSGTYFLVTSVVFPGDSNAANNTAASTGTFTI